MNRVKMLTLMFIGGLSLFLASPAFAEEIKSANMFFFSVVGGAPSAVQSTSGGTSEGLSTQSSSTSLQTTEPTPVSSGEQDLLAGKKQKRKTNR